MAQEKSCPTCGIPYTIQTVTEQIKDENGIPTGATETTQTYKPQCNCLATAVQELFPFLFNENDNGNTEQ